MKQFITQLTKKAGDEIIKHFNKDKIVKLKSKLQIVNQADLIADKIIKKEINKKYPSHQILTEESGKAGRKSQYLWIVDPLDGSTNYAMGSPLFAVAIALVKDDEIIYSSIYAPLLKELYYAEKSKGAFLNNKRIKVSNNNKLSNSFLTYCYGHDKRDVKLALLIYNELIFKTLGIRQFGSSAIEFSLLARGKIIAHIEPGALNWDSAPGVLLTREAGGKVTDFKGKQWNLKSRDLLATNGKVHDSLLKVLAIF